MLLEVLGFVYTRYTPMGVKSDEIFSFAQSSVLICDEALKRFMIQDDECTFYRRPLRDPAPGVLSPLQEFRPISTSFFPTQEDSPSGHFHSTCSCCDCNVATRAG